jgi:hypothetical protein
MTKHLKIAVLLLWLTTTPSLGAGVDCEYLASDTRALCQRLQVIEAKQDQILRNQAKIKTTLLLISRGVRLNYDSREEVEKVLKEK